MSLLEVNDVKVHFPIHRGIFLQRQVGTIKAVDGVSFTVPKGSTYGLVGESGCGKSTLGRALLRLVEPTGGSVRFEGTDLGDLTAGQMRRMRVRMQMVFQDPMSSLNPRQTVEAALTEPLKAHGLQADFATRAARVRALLDMVGLPASSAGRYPHEFSGGQRQRIGIARAISLEPDLIVADEPVSALDVSVQAQVINLLEDLQKDLGLTYIVIAHDLAVVRHISDVVGVMYLGSVVEEAPSDALYSQPLHPYTISLMSAVPIPDPQVQAGRQRIILHGELPSPVHPPKGCRFHTRCPFRQASRCDSERPVLREIAPGRKAACHYVEDILADRIRPGTTNVSTVHTEEKAHGGTSAA